MSYAELVVEPYGPVQILDTRFIEIVGLIVLMISRYFEYLLSAWNDSVVRADWEV